MDFRLSDEQDQIKESVGRYCREKYTFKARTDLLRTGEPYSREHWTDFARLGWLGMSLPAELDGLGGSAIETSIVMQQFGRALVREPYLWCSVLAAQTLACPGNAPICGDLVRGIVQGANIIALAHFEQQARGDVEFVNTLAHATGRSYVLEGAKTFVPGGSTATSFVVSARRSEHELGGVDSLQLFHVPAGSAGLSQRNFRTIDGHGASELSFKGLELPPEALLAEGAQAYETLRHGIDHGTVGVCAEAVGAMEGVIEVTTEYVKARQAYGTTLSSFQAIQHKLADMLLELELSRSSLFSMLQALSSPADDVERRKALCGAKALIGRAGQFVGANGIQLHGGMGMADDYIIGHYFKRLTVIEQQLGAPAFHLSRYADLLLAQAAPARLH